MIIGIVETDLGLDNKYFRNIEVRSIARMLNGKYEHLMYIEPANTIISAFLEEFRAQGGKAIGIKKGERTRRKCQRREKELIDHSVSINQFGDRLYYECENILCFPGSLNTYEYIFNHLILNSSLRNGHRKNIYIYNYQKYYSPLMLQLETGVECGLIDPSVIENIITFEYVDQLNEILHSKK